MTMTMIQKKFFCVLPWHDVFRTKTALKKAFKAYMAEHPEGTPRMAMFDSVDEKMHEWSHYMVNTDVVEKMFDSESDVNKLIRKLTNDETFQALWPDRCSRYHVFKSKKDGLWHIEEQLDLFKDTVKAILDAR